MIEYAPNDFPRPAPELSTSYVRCLDSGEWWPDVWTDEVGPAKRRPSWVVGALVFLGALAACAAFWAGAVAVFL